MSDLDRRRLLFVGGGITATTLTPIPRTWATQFDPTAFAGRTYCNPLQFGAVGDGMADDTVPVQMAASAARAGGVLFLPRGKTFGIIGYIYVLDGVAGVIGGGILKVLSSAPETSGLVLAGKASGHASNVFNCVVEGITFDCNHRRALAIYGQNISHCKIVRNTVLNCSVSGVGILVRSFISGGASGEANIVAFNDVHCDASGINDSVMGIQCDAQADFSPFKDAVECWKSTFTSVEAKYPALNDQIVGNRVFGGYYGISLLSARFTRVRANHCFSNTRSISAQDACEGLLIEGNVLQDSISASVHLAYGSVRNTVRSNRIVTRRADGEGLLQSYVGSRDNTFIENDVRVSAGAPLYHAYCAVQSDRCSFTGNRFEGPALLAYIGVESAWNGAVGQPASRAYRRTKSEDGFARTGMAGTRISKNTIIGGSAVPAIYLGQISDARGSYALRDVVIEDNTVIDAKSQPQLLLFEMSPGDLNISSRRGNSFDRKRGSSALGLSTPRP